MHVDTCAFGDFTATASPLITSSGVTSPHVTAEPRKEEHLLGKYMLYLLNGLVQLFHVVVKYFNHRTVANSFC